MNIRDYQEGIPSKSLRNAVKYLNKNYIKIIDYFILDEKNPNSNDLDYLTLPFDENQFKLPKNIYNRLNLAEIDFLECEFQDLKVKYCKNKSWLIKKYKKIIVAIEKFDLI